jgi:Domain of unknown function (DUF4129)
MIRRWDELAADLDDVLPLPLAALGLMLLALLAGILWYTFPNWLPNRWWSGFWRGLRRVLSRVGGALRRAPGRLVRLRWRGLRLGRLSWRWRRRGRADSTPVAEPTADDALPDRPVEHFLSLADWYAGQGRWAEAVRERLRGIVRALVDAGIIDVTPGWTVVELAGAAAAVLPPVHPAVNGASQVFSDIWYGQRPATADDDTTLRGYAGQVDTVLSIVRAGAR